MLSLCVFARTRWKQNEYKTAKNDFRPTISMLSGNGKTLASTQSHNQPNWSHCHPAFISSTRFRFVLQLRRTHAARRKAGQYILICHRQPHRYRYMYISCKLNLMRTATAVIRDAMMPGIHGSGDSGCCVML